MKICEQRSGFRKELPGIFLFGDCVPGLKGTASKVKMAQPLHYCHGQGIAGNNCFTRDWGMS